jgi:DNA polymerase-3 subunit epsilon
MEEDFTAHRADEDTAATWAVLRGQLDMYSPDNQEDESRQLPNDMDALARMSKTKNESIDFAGRIVWRTVTDSDGKPVVDSNGNEVKREAINFGKYKGWYVTDVFSRDTAYYQWIMRGDFTNDTKTVLTRIYMKWKQNKM